MVSITSENTANGFITLGRIGIIQDNLHMSVAKKVHPTLWRSLDLFVKGMQKSPEYAQMFSRGFKKGLNTVVNDYEKVTRPAECRSYPQMLNIAITDMCNLGCVHCPRTYDDSIDLSQLDPETVKECIDKVSPHANKVQLSGGLGEPLLYDGLFDVISHAKSHNMDVWMISNGTLLDEDAAHRIIDSGLDYLSISLDGATEESYENIRRGADFEEVVSNVSRFCDIRERRNSDIRVRLVPVLFYEENLEELTDFIDIGARTGVDGIGFNELKEPLDTENITAAPLRNQDDQEFIQRKFREAQAYADEKGIEITLPIEDERPRCVEPWDMLTVTTNGHVRPCCTGPFGNFIGNLLEDDLEDIWNSEEFVDWRESMLSDEPPQACVDCQKPIY